MRERFGGSHGSAVLRSSAAEACVGGVAWGQVPYPRSFLSYMQTIFARLDDSDGSQGITALRNRLLSQGDGAGPIDAATQAGVEHHPGDLNAEGEEEEGFKDAAESLQTSLWFVMGNAASAAIPPHMKHHLESLRGLQEDILDAEAASRWEDAVGLYEAALGVCHTLTSALDAESHGALHGLQDPAILDRALLEGNIGLQGVGTQGSGGAAATEKLKPLKQGIQQLNRALHAGLLRCFDFLGHQETAMLRAQRLLQDKELLPIVTPFALTSAWKLNRWGDLADMMERFEKQTPLPPSSSLTAWPSSAPATAAPPKPFGVASASMPRLEIAPSPQEQLQAAMIPTQNFEAHLALAMLSLRRLSGIWSLKHLQSATQAGSRQAEEGNNLNAVLEKEQHRFAAAVKQARTLTLGLLSAAGMESYHRFVIPSALVW